MSALGCVLAAASILISVTLYAQNRKAAEALCTFKTDLQRRVDDGNEFLAKHPNGIPGIPAKTLRTSLDNQQRTISALRGLSCPPPPKSHL